MKLPKRFKNLKFTKGSEKGSVTLFVLIAMLFFLAIGIMIFIINMNTGLSQKKDLDKIQTEYNKDVNTSDLDQAYEEAKQRQIGKFFIEIVDNQGNIYKSGEWVNKSWIGEGADGKLPLKIKPYFPEGLTSVDVTIRDDETNQAWKILKKAILENFQMTRDNEGKYKIINNIDNTNQIQVNIDVTEPVINDIPGGEVWIVPDGTNTELNITISATDPNGARASGMDNGKIEYIISKTAPDANTTGTIVEGSSTQVKIDSSIGEGDYKIYARATDLAGNISDWKESGEISVRVANYIITTGTDTRYAETLADAIIKAKAASTTTESTIKPLKDLTDNSEATIDKNVTIDTNGKTITMSNTITVAANTTATFVDTATTKGKLERVVADGVRGDLIRNNGTVVVGVENSDNGPTLTSKDVVIGGTGTVTVYGGNIVSQGQSGVADTSGISCKTINVYGGNITNDSGPYGIVIASNGIGNITGGTITGATNGISMTGANSTLTIGNNSNALNKTTPVITGTTGTGINIAGATSTLNYYDGKIIGKEKGTKTFNGREVAFSVKDDTTVNFLTETGNVTRYYRPYTRENTQTHLFETVLEKQVNVTFNPGEGATVAESNRNVLTNVEYKEKAETAEIASLPTPTKTGYTFKGWNGKNLFNKDDTPEIPDYYITGDGNNYYHGGYSIYKISLKPNTTYTITNSGNSYNPGYAVYDSSDTRIFGENYSNKKVVTFTTPSTTAYIKFSVVTQESSTNYEKDIFQIEEGTTATPYEPYYITDDTKVVQDQDHTLNADWEINKYNVTYNYGINQNFKNGEYFNTGYTVDWSKDFTIETTFNIAESGKRYLIIGGYDENSLAEFNIEVFSNDKLRLYFGKSGTAVEKAFDKVYTNEDVNLKFIWNAKTKNYNVTAKGTQTDISETVAITDDRFASGTSEKALRIGAKDYRNTGNPFNSISIKALKITHKQEYDSVINNINNVEGKIGYTFDGWYTEDTFTNKVTASTKVPANNIDVYAKWTANNYTVTAHANGGAIASTTGWEGTGESATKQVTYDSAYGTLPEVTKTGYTLKGWNGKNLFDEEKWLMAVNGATHEDGYYVFDPSKADVLYGKSGSGVYTGSKEIDPGFKENTQYTISMKCYTDYNSSDSVYETIYIGFCYTDGTYTQIGMAGATEVLKTLVSKDGKTVDKIFISYGRGGANVHIKYIQLEEGSTATPYEPYYITAETPVTTASNHDINAIWEATPYTVTLNATPGTIDAGDDGWTRAGDNKTATKDITYDSDYGTLPTASRPGYEFDGWFTEATGGTQVIDTTKMQTASAQTLYPHWTANNYTIHFNANGGTGTMADEAMTYDVEKALTKNTFTKTGYSFAGWSQANEGFDNTLLYSNDEEMYAGHNAFYNSTSEFIRYADLAQYFDRYGTNAKYRLEYDVMSDNTTSFNGIAAYFQNGSTTRYAFEPNNEQGNVITSTGKRFTTVSSTEWTHDSFDFKVLRTENSDNEAYLAFYGEYGTGNKPRVKNVRLYIIPNYTDEQEVINLTAENNGTVNLYAVWTANNYTVTADAMGGTVTSAEGWDTTGAQPTKTVTFDSAYGTLPTVTRTGYTFKGWNGKNLLNLDVPESTPSDTAEANTTNRTFTPNTYVKGLAHNNTYGTNSLSNVQIGVDNIRLLTNNGYGVGYILQCTQNNNYVLSYNSSTNGANPVSSVMFYGADGSYISNKVTLGDGNKSVQFAVPGNAYYTVLMFGANGTNTQVEFSNIMLEQGSTATAYEPYYITDSTLVARDSDHTLYADWTANPINLANQSKSVTYSRSSQTITIDGATNGTGNYVYTEVSEKNANNADTDYISIDGTTITLSASTPAGTYTYGVHARDSESGSEADGTITITVNPYDISGANSEVSEIANETYNGSEHTPEPTVTALDTTLVKDTDYTLSYNNNINAGIAAVTITGTGNFTGSKVVNFIIDKATNPLEVNANTGLIYNTTAQNLVTPANVQGDVYYSFEYINGSNYNTAGSKDIPTGIDAGTYKVYWYTPGNSNYAEKSGNVEVTIGRFDISGGTVEDIPNQNYTGSEIRPTPSVTITINGASKVLSSSREIFYRYSININPSDKATIKVLGFGNYTGAIDKYFTINPLITFESNGGTGEMASQHVVYNTNTPLNSNTFTRDYYHFIGWNTDSSATTAIYADGANINTYKNTILYAIWEGNPYTVVFDANGGSGEAMANQSFKYGETKALSKNTYTKADYTFLGWNTKADGSGTMYVDEEEVSSLTTVNNGTVRLYAQWTKFGFIPETVYLTKTIPTNTATIVPEGSEGTVKFIGNSVGQVIFTSQDTNVVTVTQADGTNPARITTSAGARDGDTTTIKAIDSATNQELAELTVIIDITPPQWLMDFVEIIRRD